MKIETFEKLVPGDRVRTTENNTNIFEIGEVVIFIYSFKYDDGKRMYEFVNEKGKVQILTHLQIESL